MKSFFKTKVLQRISSNLNSQSVLSRKLKKFAPQWRGAFIVAPTVAKLYEFSFQNPLNVCD
ncbi:hypothetical protein NUACC26_052630 [Scytonema sp. NUACC26]